MHARAHRVGQEALEKAVDFSQLAAGCGFAVQCAQGHHQVLAEVPEGLQVIGEAHPVSDALNGVIAAHLKQREHGMPDATQVAIGGTPETEAGKRQEPK